MRTTVTLDDDVVAAVQRLRRERGVGLSAAVNELVRNGLVGHDQQPRPRVRLRTARLGLRLDVSNVSDALALAEGDDHR